MQKSKSKKETLVPILLGVLMIAVVIGIILLLSYTSKNETEWAEDGVVADYEEQGVIKLGDYQNPDIEVMSEEDSDDPKDAYWDDYLATCKVKAYPEDLLEEAYADLIAEYEGFAEVSGTTYDELLDEYNMTDDTVVEVAQDVVLGRLAALTIAYRESITPDDATIEEQLVELMGYDKDDYETVSDLLSDYRESYGSRPMDDVYVEVVKQWMWKRV